MDRITFRDVLPDAFALSTDIRSSVWSADFTFHKGRKYLVEAQSGSGKSSLCHYIIGYRQDYSGQIMFDDADIRGFSARQWTEIRKYAVSHLFQELRLFPELTAWENVVLKNNLTHFLTEREVHEYFEHLGIRDKEETLCGRLSFGQQQRVAAIRALSQPFDFLLIDEPISHLDDNNADALATLILEAVNQQGAGLITTSIGKHFNLPYDHTARL